MTCKHCTMSEHESGKLSWLQGEPYEDDATADKSHIEASEDGTFMLVCEHFEPFDDEPPTWVETQVAIERCPWCGDIPSVPAGPEPGCGYAARMLSDWIERYRYVLGNLEEGASFLQGEVLAHIQPQETLRPKTREEMLAIADGDGIACIRGIVRMSVDDLFDGIEKFDDDVSELLTGTCLLQDISYSAVSAIDGDVLVEVCGHVDTASL